MDSSLKIALIAAIGGLAGGLITGVLGPHINWGIEKRKQKLAHRRELIKAWRRMIPWAVFSYKHQPSETYRPFVVVLESSEDFLSLHPHLSRVILKQLDDARSQPQNMIWVKEDEAFYQDPPEGLVPALADEISRIERQWGLVD